MKTYLTNSKKGQPERNPCSQTWWTKYKCVSEDCDQMFECKAWLNFHLKILMLLLCL